MERTTPPPGYVCHRCNVSGHFIQHCSTNGNPNFDVKRVKPPTGIPKSMLMATPNGSYSLPSGAVAVLKPNEDAFEKEMEGLTSTTRSVGEFPPELKCPLCKEVMRDAALASKCCLKSYCDKC
jgi:E3 ubiquitin-protein ligase RBBP6